VLLKICPWHYKSKKYINLFLTKFKSGDKQLLKPH